MAPADSDLSVRTIEWNGQELLRGRRLVDHGDLACPGQVVAVTSRTLAVVGLIAVGLFLLACRRRSR